MHQRELSRHYGNTNNHTLWFIIFSHSYTRFQFICTWLREKLETIRYGLPKLSSLYFASPYFKEGMKCCDGQYLEDILGSNPFSYGSLDVANDKNSLLKPSQICEQVTNSFHGNHNCVMIIMDEDPDQDLDQGILDAIVLMQGLREKAELYGVFLRSMHSPLWEICWNYNYFTSMCLKSNMKRIEYMFHAFGNGTSRNLFERHEVKTKFKINLPITNVATLQIQLKSEQPSRQVRIQILGNEMFQGMTTTKHVHDNALFELDLVLKTPSRKDEFLRYILWDSTSNIILDEGQLRFRVCDLVSELVYHCLKDRPLKMGIISNCNEMDLFVNGLYTLIDHVTDEKPNKNQQLSLITNPCFLNEGVQEYSCRNVTLVCYETQFNDESLQLDSIIENVDIIVFYASAYRYLYYSKRILEACRLHSKPCTIALHHDIIRDEREENEILKHHAIEIPEMIQQYDGESTCTDFQLDVSLLPVVEGTVKQVFQKQQQQQHNGFITNLGMVVGAIASILLFLIIIMRHS